MCVGLCCLIVAPDLSTNLSAALRGQKKKPAYHEKEEEEEVDFCGVSPPTVRDDMLSIRGKVSGAKSCAMSMGANE